MSVRGLNEVAVQRDLGAAQRIDGKTQKSEDLEKTKAQGYLDLLVTAIPTEPLALYTFVVAGVVATIGTEASADKRLTMRWVIFGVTTAFIVLWMLASYLRKSHEDEKENRALPLPEILIAVIAFGAWGLAMPESPLMAELSGSDKTVWTIIITAAGAALLGLLTGTLKQPSKKAAVNQAAEKKSADDTADDADGDKKPEPDSVGLLAAIGAAVVAGAEAFRSRRPPKGGTAEA